MSDDKPLCVYEFPMDVKKHFARTLSEIQAVRAEYSDGQSVTIDEYLANRSDQR